MAKRNGKQSRFSLSDRLASMAEKAEIRRMKKEGASREEIAQEHRWTPVPNRKHLRSVGINITHSASMYGRLVRYRLTPCSLQTSVAIHTIGSDGNTKKFIVPRDRYENKDA